MKVMVWAGLLALAGLAFAAEAKASVACDANPSPQTEHERVAAPAPPPRLARPVLARRQEAERDARATRRRGGRHIPDAELIGPRGSL
jgi:hypothetical protein